MSEAAGRNHQSIPDMGQEGAPASWKKFFVHSAGETLGAHEDWVSKFKSIGQSEVKSHEESDYILLFCPIVSRVGTDISEALENNPGGKTIILIVMHHTFDPKYITADSRGLVEHRDVLLVVDSLFYEGRLLNSYSNDRAWSEIQRFFGVPAEVSDWSRFINSHGHHTPAQKKGQSAAQTEKEMRERTGDRNYQSISDMGQEGAPVSWKKFFVHLSGQTLEAHEDWVSKFKSIGQSEVKSPEKSDYILLFCPNVSRVGTDIDEASEKTPGGKKIILIVMHHTFNPKYITAESRGLVEHRDVLLVVDSLFYEGRLLNCDSNDRAWSEIQRFFGVPAEVSLWSRFINWFKKNRWTSLGAGIGTVAVVILVSVLYHILHKHE